ncbi:unnamed protein product, partial [Brenthis ino]
MMPVRRKISPRQMDILLEFAESNSDIALGRLTGGPLAHQATRQAWVSVANKLNAIAEGSTKTADQWRRYWIEFKAKTKSKAADSRRNASATGGGPNKLVPLTDTEERVLAIIGTVAVEGLPGVRLPLDIPTAEGTQPPGTSEAVPASPSTASPMPHSSAPCSDIISPEPPMDVEWLEEETQSPLLPDTEPPAPATEHPAPATHTIQSVNPPEVASPREERPPVHTTLPTQRSTSRSQIRRDERVPRWAYDLEERRIAVEERIASALEAMVELMREIKCCHILESSRHQEKP